MVGITSFSRINFWAWLKLLTYNDIGIVLTDGAPTSGTSGSFAGHAGIGCLLIDKVNGKLYINTNTKASPTWTVVGAQTT